MITENEFKLIVAKNLIKFRKANGLTQLELAQKLNYSDKAISKWERGESLPDIYMLNTIANLFGITLNDLVSEESEIIKPKGKLNKGIVIALSTGLTWLVAVVMFVILMLANIDFAWLSFIYAIPASLIVLIVFSKMWGYKPLLFISISLLYFTIPLAICATAGFIYPTPLLFIIAAPLEILTILWFNRKRK